MFYVIYYHNLFFCEYNIFNLNQHTAETVCEQFHASESVNLAGSNLSFLALKSIKFFKFLNHYYSYHILIQSMQVVRMLRFPLMYCVSS